MLITPQSIASHPKMGNPTSQLKSRINPIKQSQPADSVCFSGPSKNDHIQLQDLLLNNKLLEEKTGLDILAFIYLDMQNERKEYLEKHPSEDTAYIEKIGASFFSIMERFSPGNLSVLSTLLDLMVDVGLLRNTNNPQYPNYLFTPKGRTVLEQSRPQLFRE